MSSFCETANIIVCLVLFVFLVCCVLRSFQYDSLLKDLKHYRNTMAAPSLLLGLVLNANEALLGQKSSVKKSLLRNLQRRISSWITSTEQFLRQILKSYPLYPDVVMETKWALTMVCVKIENVLFFNMITDCIMNLS